jgi:plastocyanin
MGAVVKRLLVVVPLLMATMLVAPVSRTSLPRVAAQGDEASVEIQDFQFSPDTLEVTVGTTVTWTNTGDAPHTVTSDDGIFDSGELASGDTFSWTFDEPGEFAYHCNIHQRMKATIVVKEAVAQAGNETSGNETAGNETAGNETGGNATGGNETAGGDAVEIQDFQFSPDTLEVSVGTTVTWTNAGQATHTVTADDGTFDSGELNPGDDFSFTFDEAGEFTYHCDIHPRMQGTIVVTGEAAGNATEEPTAKPTKSATTAPTAAATKQTTPTTSNGPATIVGGATDGNNALEYVGRLDQRGTNLTIYGYLTHIAGLDDSQLFTDTDPTNWNEGTARFTFFGSAQITSRAEVGAAVIATTAEGPVKFFLNENGGGTFDVPEGFLSGTQIAEANVRVHDVLSVYAKAKGIANGEAALVWTSDEPFDLGGETFQLGKVDGKHRLTFSGLGTLQDPNEPRATVAIGGSSVSIAAPAAGTAEATPETGGNATAGTEEVTINMRELNDSGISGTATLRANGDQTDVELHLDGATGGHPVHIHQGTCDDLDPNPAYPLENVDANGESTTTVDISLTDLLASPYAINVHKSADEIGIYVACGEIVSQG